MRPCRRWPACITPPWVTQVKIMRRLQETRFFAEGGTCAQALYDWWLYRLCDVFIELVKPAMASGTDAERQAYRETLWICLETGLRHARPPPPPTRRGCLPT